MKLFLVALVCSLGFSTWAADDLSASSSLTGLKAPGLPEQPSLDEFGRENPRSAMENLWDALDQGDYVRATNYFDFSRLAPGTSPAEKIRLANKFRVLMDHEHWVNLESISSLPSGDANDGLPPDREKVGHLSIASESADVVLQRIRGAHGVPVWLISPQTVARIPALYNRLAFQGLEAVLPARVMDALLVRKFMGLPLALVVKLAYTLLLFALLLVILSKVALAILHRFRPGFFYHFVHRIYPPLLLLLLVTVFRNYYRNEVLSDDEAKIYNAATGLIIAAIWLVSRLVDFASDSGRYELTRRGQSASVPLVNLARRVVKVVLIILGFTLWLENQGFNVTTILAGLGVAGIAVGLAGQKLIEDLFGAITLYGTGRVKRDDFIRYGTRLGTVEDIGLRLTTIRSLDRTIVSLPNGIFAHMEIENFKHRDRIWFHPRIGLRYETTPDQLRYILVEIRKLLYAHSKVLNDGARVRFTGFGAYSLDLDIFCYVAESAYAEYLGVAEDLNLRIMDIVAKAGSGFAFPSQTTYFERGQGLDKARARQAESEVEKWKADQQLYLPAFPEDKIRELEGTVEFPPAGSPPARPGS